MSLSPKQKLEALGNRVHDALRLLRLGDKNVIACKEDTSEEIINYIYAYAIHKRKWFIIRYDKVSNVLHVERAEEPKPKYKENQEEVE
jgi:hypothetical protein